MLTAFLALALQAAPAPAPGADDPFAAVGRAWAECTKARVDAGLASGRPADELANAAIEGCARQQEAIRAAIAQRMGPEAADANIVRIRSGTAALMRAYIARERGEAAPQPQ